MLVFVSGLVRARQGADLRKCTLGNDQNDDVAIAHCLRHLPTFCLFPRDRFPKYLYTLGFQAVGNQASC
jgi:hypothetical protein